MLHEGGQPHETPRWQVGAGARGRFGSLSLRPGAPGALVRAVELAKAPGGHFLHHHLHGAEPGKGTSKEFPCHLWPDGHWEGRP